MAERMVGLLKRSLRLQINKGALLDYVQFEALLLRVAALLNARPLSARSFSGADFMAITPRDLLLGRAPSLSVGEMLEQERMEAPDHRLARQMAGVEEKLRVWWKRFLVDVFPLLVPRRAMQHLHEHPEVGDLVLVRYPGRVGQGVFRLGRVVRLHPDAHGVVRTVTLWLRNRVAASREPAGTCRAGVTTLLAPVQRLVMILPAKEQPPDLIKELRESLAEEGELDQGGERLELQQEEEEEQGGEQGPEEGGEVEEEVPGVHTPAGASPEPEPGLRVQVPAETPPQMQDLPPMPQRVRGRRIARPDWARVLR